MLLTRTIQVILFLLTVIAIVITTVIVNSTWRDEWVGRNVLYSSPFVAKRALAIPSMGCRRVEGRKNIAQASDIWRIVGNCPKLQGLADLQDWVADGSFHKGLAQGTEGRGGCCAN